MTVSETEKQILKFISATIVEKGVAPTLDEIGEYMEFDVHTDAKFHVDKLVGEGLVEYDLGKRGSVKLAGDAKKGIEDALRKQISLLGSTNRALEKQNENLHRRVEHLRKELNKKAKEVEELRARGEK
jgi:SOS-response transcriptional repressor LexA